MWKRKIVENGIRETTKTREMNFGETGNQAEYNMKGMYAA